jgi:hypothetical protein
MKTTQQAWPKAVTTVAEQLKKKHNLEEVHIIEVDGRIAYLKKPTRMILKMIESTAQTTYDEAEILLENCWLEGDEAIKTEDDLFYSSMALVLNLVTLKKARVKKL